MSMQLPGWSLAHSPAATQRGTEQQEDAAAAARAAEDAERARVQAAEKAAAERATAEAKRQEQFAASANQAAALKRKALEKRQATMADPLGLGAGSGTTTNPSTVALPTDDPWGFVASAPAPAVATPVPVPSPAPGPAATPYSSSAFEGLGSGPAAVGSGTYTVVLPKTSAGFGIKLNNTPAGDAFVEGFSHAGPQQAGIVVGSIFVSVAGVPVTGRGQEGVIAVLKHPQYGANPASPSVPFEFKLPANQI